MSLTVLMHYLIRFFFLTSSHSTRFKIEVPLPEIESNVTYRINGGHALNFWVPAIGQNLRWASHSCNGFSGGVPIEEVCRAASTYLCGCSRR